MSVENKPEVMLDEKIKPQEKEVKDDSGLEIDSFEDFNLDDLEAIESKVFA